MCLSRGISFDSLHTSGGLWSSENAVPRYLIALLSSAITRHTWYTDLYTSKTFNNLLFQFYSKTLPNLTKLRLKLGWAVVYRSHRVLFQADCSWQELSSCSYKTEVITSLLLSTRNYFYQLHIKFHNRRSPQGVHEYVYFHQGYQRTCKTVNNPYPPNWWLSCL